MRVNKECFERQQRRSVRKGLIKEVWLKFKCFLKVSVLSEIKLPIATTSILWLFLTYKTSAAQFNYARFRPFACRSCWSASSRWPGTRLLSRQPWWVRPWPRLSRPQDQPQRRIRSALSPTFGVYRTFLWYTLWGMQQSQWASIRAGMLRLSRSQRNWTRPTLLV